MRLTEVLRRPPEALSAAFADARLDPRYLPYDGELDPLQSAEVQDQFS